MLRRVGGQTVNEFSKELAASTFRLQQSSTYLEVLYPADGASTLDRNVGNQFTSRKVENLKSHQKKVRFRRATGSRYLLESSKVRFRRATGSRYLLRSSKEPRSCHFEPENYLSS
jgi:hypothetical protein